MNPPGIEQTEWTLTNIILFFPPLYLYLHLHLHLCLCLYLCKYQHLYLQNLPSLRVRVSTVNFVPVVFAPDTERSCIKNLFLTGTKKNYFTVTHFCQSPSSFSMAKMWSALTARNIRSRPWLHPGTLRDKTSSPDIRQKTLMQKSDDEEETEKERELTWSVHWRGHNT